VALPPETAPDPNDVLRGLAVNPLKEVDPTALDVETQALFGRGSYLVNAISDCSGCHTNIDLPNGNIDTAVYLTGGQLFATPVPTLMATTRAASSDLVGATHGFFNQNGFSTFLTVITQGIHAESPSKAPLAFPMPWTEFKNLNLDDLQAIYTYMSTVASTYGKTTLTGALDQVVPAPALYCDTSNSTIAACPPHTTCSTPDGGAGECLPQTCTTSRDCAACQTCDTITHSCALLPPVADAGPSQASCLANGYTATTQY
jgi:hypothetical protein